MMDAGNADDFEYGNDNKAVCLDYQESKWPTFFYSNIITLIITVIN